MDPLRPFLADIQRDYTPLDAAQQQLLAEVLSQAWGSGRSTMTDFNNLPFPGAQGMGLPPGLRIETMGDAQNALISSFTPALISNADRFSNATASVGDIFNTQVELAIPALRAFDPSRSGIQNYMNSVLSYASRKAARSLPVEGTSFERFYPASEDALEPPMTGLGGALVETPQSYWYDEMLANMGENAIPTSLYVPQGQTLIAPNGWINPNARRNPPKGRENDYVQAYIDRAQMSALAQAQAAQAPGQAEGPWTARIAKMVTRDLRRIGSNLGGGESVGGNPIGAMAQEVDAASMILESPTIAQEPAWTYEDIAARMEQLRSEPFDQALPGGPEGASGRIPGKVINRYRRDLTKMVDEKQNFGVMPELAYGNLPGFKTVRRYDENYRMVALRDDNGIDRGVAPTLTQAGQDELAANQYNELMGQTRDQLDANVSAVYQREMAEETATRGSVGPNFAKRFFARHKDEPGFNQAANAQWNASNEAAHRWRSSSYSIEPEEVPPAARLSDVGNLAPAAETAPMPEKAAPTPAEIAPALAEAPTSAEVPALAETASAPEETAAVVPAASNIDVDTPVATPEAAAFSKLPQPPSYNLPFPRHPDDLPEASKVVADATLARRIMREHFPDFNRDFLGTLDTKAEEFNEWHANLGDRKELFEVANRAIVEEHILATSTGHGGQSVKFAMVEEDSPTHGWRGERLSESRTLPKGQGGGHEIDLAGALERYESKINGGASPATAAAPSPAEAAPPAAAATPPAPATPPTADAGNAASVPFMMTKGMERQLQGMGFSDVDINRMTPSEAWEHINARAAAPASAPEAPSPALAAHAVPSPTATPSAFATPPAAAAGSPPVAPPPNWNPVDADFPEGSNWEARHDGRRVDPATGEINEPKRTPLPERYADIWRGWANNINPLSLIGKTSINLGSAQEAPGGGIQFTKEDRVTVSGADVALATNVTSQAANKTIQMGGYENLGSSDVVATFNARMQEAVSAWGKDFAERVVRESTMTEGAAKEYVARVKEVTKELARPLTEMVASSVGLVGRAGDVQYNSVRLWNADGIRQQMADNPEFARRITDTFGGPEQAAVASLTAFNVGDNSYTVGQGGSGFGTGGFGRGGPQGSGFKSLRQTDFGRLITAVYMGEFLWRQTGASILSESDKFGAQSYGYLPLESYGGDMPSSNTLYTERMQIAQEESGRLAYEKYGNLQELGYALGGTPAAQFGTSVGQSLKMAAGVGGVAGIAAYALGAIPATAALGGGLAGFLAGGAAAGAAAALPIGLTAAAAVGIPSLAMDLSNLAMDRTPTEGASWKNLIRGFAVNPLGFMPSPVEASGFAAPREYAPVTGLEISESIAGQYPGLSEYEAWKKMGYSDRMASYLTEDYASGTAAIEKLTSDIMEGSGKGLDRPTVQKGLSQIQVLVGSLKEDQNIQAAKSMFDAARVSGTSVDFETSNLSRVAQMQGITPGAPEMSGLATWFGGLDENQRQEYLLQQSQQYQLYSQFAPYAGGMAAAYQIASDIGNLTPAGTQAITSRLAQADMAGEDLSEIVSYKAGVPVPSRHGGRPIASPIPVTKGEMLAQMFPGMSPKDQINLSSFATTAWQSGAYPDYTSALQATRNLPEGLSMTPMQIGELANFNKYAWSDFGRKAGIGMFQLTDAQGRRAGEVDSSGVIDFMGQNVLGWQGVNTTVPQKQSVLDAMGIWKGDAYGYQSAYISGGARGVEALHADRMFGYQMASIGIAFAQIGEQQRFLWGSGTWDQPGPGSAWDIQNRIQSVQWEGQQASMAYSTARMETGRQFELENAQAAYQKFQASNDHTRWAQGFQYQTSTMQRGWTREDWQYQSQMGTQQFGWQMEDFDTAIRRASGFERAQLIEQKDRATLTYNEETSHVDEVRKRQEELWKREDEQHKKEVQYSEQMIKFEERAYQTSIKQRETLYAMDRADLERQIRQAEELHALQLEAQALEREHQKKSLDLQAAALGIQAQQAKEQHEYLEGLQKGTDTVGDMYSLFDLMSRYSPAIQDAVNAIIQVAGINFHASWGYDWININGSYHQIAPVVRIWGGGGGGGNRRTPV